VPSKSSKQVLCEALTAQLSASLGVNKTPGAGRSEVGTAKDSESLYFECA